MTKENIIVLSAFAVYMVIMIVIGVVYSRKTKNNEDYFLGGRNLGGWTAAMSAQASDMSGWLLMGLLKTEEIHDRSRKLADYPELFPEPLPR